MVPITDPMSRTIVDLSHPISAGMTTYPGLPGPQIADHLSRADSAGSYAPGVTFLISRLTMVGNTGTYIDSPFHRYADGVDLAGLDLERLVDVEGVHVEGTDGARAVGPGVFTDVDPAGMAVLIHTGWDRHWDSPGYGSEAPFLTRDAAAWLADRSPAVVGIDSLNIDDPADPERPAHSLLLAAGIPIVEHLCGLERLPSAGFRFTALPAPVESFSSFPVRAVAVIDG